MKSSTSEAIDAAVALAVAEALSLVTRRVDADVAVATLLARVGDDPDVLASARDLCPSPPVVAADVVAEATDLLATATMTARSRQGGADVHRIGGGRTAP